MEQFLDKLFGLAPWAAGYAALRLRVHEDVGGMLDEASVFIARQWKQLKFSYLLYAARPLQKVAVFMAVLLAITVVAMAFNMPSDPRIVGWYRFTMVLVATASILFGVYAYLLERAKPRHRLNPQGERIWNEELQMDEIETETWQPGWISLTGLGATIMVTFIALAGAFMTFGILGNSLGYSVIAYVFLLAAYACVGSFEYLMRSVAHKASRISVKDGPGIADHLFVLFSGYTWSDVGEARAERAEEFKRIIQKYAELKETSALTIATKIVALFAFALLLQVAWIGYWSGMGVIGWVLVVLLVGVPVQKLVAPATGAQLIDKLQSYKTGKWITQHLLKAIVIAVIAAAALTWAYQHYYYAGYACKVFTVVTPTGVDMGWKYYLVTLIGVSAFVAAATGGFKVGTDARSPKAIKWGAWTVFVLASLIGMYLGYGLIQPKVYGAANACVAATERKVGSVSDDPPATEEGEGKEESKRELAKALVGELLPKMVVLAGKALDEKALRLLAEAERKAKDTSKPDEPVVSPLASAQPPRPPLPPSRKARTPSRATPSSAPPATTPGSSEEQRTKAAEAIAFLRSRSAKK